MYLLNLRHNSVKSVLVKLGGIRAAFFFPAGTYGMLETCFRGETDAVTLLSVFGLPFLWLCAVVPCLRLLNRQYCLLYTSLKTFQALHMVLAGVHLSRVPASLP